ncbi:EloA [Trypoxylus dichotomus]
MPDSSELLKNIVHYQKSLDRYSQSRDDAKILHCIFKLHNMPVTVTHLEETGIGRTVNSLRKLGGEVEDAAKTLVRKWKDMVSKKDEENEPENRSNGISNREGRENNSSHKDSDKYKSSDRKETPNRDSKYKSKKDKYDNHQHQSSSESKYKSSSSKYSKGEDDRDSYESDNEEEDNESGVASESEDSSSSSSSSSSSEEEQVPVPKVSKHERESRKHTDKEVTHKDSPSERSLKHKRDSEGSRRKERSRSEEKVRKHESELEHDRKKRQKRDSSSSEREQVVKTKLGSSKRKHEDSASDEDVKKKMTKKSSASPHTLHRSSSSHRSKEANYDHKKESKSEIVESSHRSKERGSSRDRKENSKSNSNRKDSKSSSKSESKYTKQKSETYNEDSARLESPKYKKERDNSGNDKKNGSDKDKSKSKHNSKSSSSGSNSSGGGIAKIVDIGSESGTSFAEALGMLEPTTSKISSKKSKSSLEIVNHHKTEKIEKERIREKSTEKPSTCDKIDIVIPPPPPKTDIDINIASLLPPITPNYRPISNPFFDNGSTRNKVMNDDEALSLVMSQKNMRTKVYSGNKCFFGTVPTLFELCLRVLQDNIDALEYTGGVPYAILKPILDKATPDQLFMLEHHNPYLIEDTDEIWKFHCQKEFRNKKREEMESWREMYMRCLDEREAKLKALTENIKLAQDKSIPVRQTKLAYVDSVVKPPRDVIRKQAKSGIIDKKPAVTPSSRLTSLATAGAAGQVAVPSPVRASSSSGSSTAMKPKKAPLMQKTLQFLKGNRFRR